jgi:precorrin-6Y C5,15-methyltransferase (decarboxylating)
MQFVVIGITDHPKPFFPPEVLEVIKNGKFFSGGKRHHEIVASLLPENAVWIDITVPLDAVFERYASVFTPCSSLPVIVFASGDPLFFGFANTIKRRMPKAEVMLYPSFNSLQLLAHRLVMPYHDMRIVSLTGRPWHEFDKALIEGAEKIGVLTDHEHTPSTISERMVSYGYTDFLMSVGEHLGNPSLERVITIPVEEARLNKFSHPNCMILQRLVNHHRRFGIADSEFALLDGREKMITKMPIRLLTLQALDLPRRHVLWDIGSCTGSVSIEARLQFPHLHVAAFEIRPGCEALIHENTRRFGVPGTDVHIGDFLNTNITALPHPDAVFIGGHGGHLKEIMAKVLTVLTSDGVIVFNSVTSSVVTQMTDRPSSRRLWDEACTELNLQQEAPLRIQLNDYNPIEILKATQKT